MRQRSWATPTDEALCLCSSFHLLGSRDNTLPGSSRDTWSVLVRAIEIATSAVVAVSGYTYLDHGYLDS